MRYPASEKLEIIRIVEQSHLPTRRTLEQLGIPRATFHRWYDRFLIGGVEALEDRSPRPGRVWNRIPEPVRDRVIDLALDRPELSPRELAVTFTDTEGYFVSEASVYRLSPAQGRRPDHQPGLHRDKGGQRVQGQDDRDQPAVADRFHLSEGHRLGLVLPFYLSTILDDFSRYIIAWRLCTTMKAEDVTDTLNLALVASGCDRATVRQRPRLLSDNGPCYIAGELADWLQDRDMDHTRGAPNHPQTQGKIERWHQTLKNRILLENYFFPGDLEAQIAAFVERYNHRRYHESLDNLTPADVYFGRGQTILLQRERIKRKTIELRRLQHRNAAA